MKCSAECMQPPTPPKTNKIKNIINSNNNSDTLFDATVTENAKFAPNMSQSSGLEHWPLQTAPKSMSDWEASTETQSTIKAHSTEKSWCWFSKARPSLPGANQARHYSAHAFMFCTCSATWSCSYAQNQRKPREPPWEHEWSVQRVCFLIQFKLKSDEGQTKLKRPASENKLSAELLPCCKLSWFTLHSGHT